MNSVVLVFRNFTFIGNERLHNIAKLIAKQVAVFARYVDL